MWRAAERPCARGGYARRPMADRDQIVSFLNELLDIGAYPDGMPVGMQVPGTAQVRRVATGVSASLELFQRAAQDGADMLIVHHGLFFGSGPRPPLSDQDRDRLKTLFDHDITLAGYHLALDAHPQVLGRGPDSIERVAVISGGASQYVAEAAAAGAACFITGEPSEQAKWAADEAGIHCIAAGHYATEVFGVQALGALLVERFSVEHGFIDIPNPV